MPADAAPNTVERTIALTTQPHPLPDLAPDAWLDAAAQAALWRQVRAVLRAAPAYQPRMPRTDQPLSVRMTNAGPLGWVPTKAGYGYQPAHPETGEPWPPIPPLALEAWKRFGDWPHPPEACLINLYGPGSRMGLHRDFDEAEVRAPVVSLSLGQDAVYRLGNVETRGAPTRSFRLASGDVMTLKGEARLAFHGVDRIVPGTGPEFDGWREVLPEGGRVNLTLRRVTKA